MDDHILNKFIKFHRINHFVYSEIVCIARNKKRSGHDHFSMKAIFEILRARVHNRISLDNDFSALYARVVMAREDDLAGFFEVRMRKA